MKVNFKLCTKQLHLPKSIKCLGVRIDENLGWKDHVNETASKLIRRNTIITKLRYYVNFTIGFSHL